MQKTGCDDAGRVMIRSACIACLGFVLCCAFLFVGAVLVDRNILPENMVVTIALGSVAFTVLCVAFFAAGNDKHRILGSLCAGFIYFLLALLCGLVLGGEVDFAKAAIIGSLIVADAVAGAILSGLVRG